MNLYFPNEKEASHSCPLRCFMREKIVKLNNMNMVKIQKIEKYCSNDNYSSKKRITLTKKKYSKIHLTKRRRRSKIYRDIPKLIYIYSSKKCHLDSLIEFMRRLIRKGALCMYSLFNVYRYHAKHA